MENVDLEIAGGNMIQNTVKSLLDSVERNKNPTNKFSPSIYKAPSTLRCLSPSSFDPRVVSIGPLHREDENVQSFEERKASFVHDLLQRLKPPPEETLGKCVEKVADSIEKIRGCYAGMKEFSDTELAKMMVMDACFILEFIYWRLESDDSASFNMLLAQSITYDLVLLENQIPFFVLKDVFECTISKFEPDLSLIEFILPVLK